MFLPQNNFLLFLLRLCGIYIGGWEESRVGRVSICVILSLLISEHGGGGALQSFRFKFLISLYFPSHKMETNK